MPPDPIFSFSIPSVHDDILLECRVYSPPPSFFLREKPDTNRILRGAVIAHPYASFGGCYDDHVVLGLVTEVLRLGFVVGTFNFRYSRCQNKNWILRLIASLVQRCRRLERED